MPTESRNFTELQGKVVSNTRLKKIERDFNAKCDYLGQRGLLAGPQVRILKKLHKYRNETYHRDVLRPATLASAAKIYIYLVCSMMRNFPVYMIALLASDPPPALARYTWLMTSAARSCSASARNFRHESRRAC